MLATGITRNALFSQLSPSISQRTSCSNLAALINPDLLALSSEIANAPITRELQLEAAMHVSVATASQCFELYGVAPELTDSEQIINSSQDEVMLEALITSDPGERRAQLQHHLALPKAAKDVAACLMTPDEPLSELNEDDELRRRNGSWSLSRSRCAIPPGTSLLAPAIGMAANVGRCCLARGLHESTAQPWFVPFCQGVHSPRKLAIASACCQLTVCC